MDKSLRIFASIACLFIATSCATMSMTELRPTGTIPTLLPALEPQVDVYSVENVYAYGSPTRDVDLSIRLDGDDYQPSYNGIAIESNTSFRDPRVQDVITLFTREMQNNISSPIGQKRGTAYCRIAAGNATATGWPLLIVSCMTFFIPSFVGLPLGFYKTELDVDVEIRNLDGNCIGTYSAIGAGKIPVAMYYGYNASDASRKSAAVAFKNAMTDIKAQIAADAERLNEALQ